MLKPLKRHYAPCKRKEWDQGYTRCGCPVWIRGTLRGKRVTASASKYLPEPDCRDIERGRDLALLWEKIGELVRPEAYAAIVPPGSSSDEVARNGTADQPTVDMAVVAYLKAARDRKLLKVTLEKKSLVFEKRLLPFCAAKGIRFVSELDLTTTQEWRGTWGVSPLVTMKRQKEVIGFFWFCERAGWFPPNYAANLTTGLGRIEVKASQTAIFEPNEYRAIIDATYIYSDRPSIDKHNSLTLGGERIRALTEVMRWTGLSIRDAVTLEKRRLARDPQTGLSSIIVHRKKTGEPVYCPVPPHVTQMLATLPASQKGNTNETYFFWTGNGTSKTITTNWQRSYGKLFKLAAIKEADGTPKRCHPHMFRDTFAVESMLAGMKPIEVSLILGHSSVTITEKHYLPFVRRRQTSLNDSVVESWRRQGIIDATETKRGPGRPRRVTPLPVAVGE
jgi:integrase/recombinase XerD